MISNMIKTRWSGFTLIELMIASVLTALAALAAYHTYNQGILIWKKGQENSNQDKAIITMERISRDLKNIFSFEPVGFSGEEAKIAFPRIAYRYDWLTVNEDAVIEPDSSAAESPAPLPLITKMTYEYDKNEGKLSRLEEVYAYPDLEELKVDPDGMKKESSRVILEDIEILTFSYAVTKTPELSFTNNALNSGVPYAIKIELKLKSMKDALTRTIIIPVIKPPRNEDR
ncbi:MAG: prepilin-type N-terminal cleavage/methylation domain-containing protein [Planctomycetes bacterium]|nr:prepilin-type N-terminal cleavage/methylation domain-containing protein [Planctomycetota bacterium]